MSSDFNGDTNGQNGLKGQHAGGLPPRLELPRVLNSGPKKGPPPPSDPQVLLDKLEVQLRYRFDTCLALVQATQREYLACLEGNKTICSSVEHASAVDELPLSPGHTGLGKLQAFQSDLGRLGEDETLKNDDSLSRLISDPASLAIEDPIRLNSGFTRQSSDSTITVSSFGDRRDAVSKKNGRLLHNMTMSYPENKRRKKAMRQADKKDHRLSDTPGELDNSAWRAQFQRLVAGQAFQGAVFVLIFSNTLFLGYEVNDMATSSGPADRRPEKFIIVDGVYTALFLLELLFRGASEGCRSFWCSVDWRWNVFDVLVITTSVMELLAPLVFLNNTSMDLTWLRTFRFIRVTRLLRTLRIVRLVRFIRSLRTLLHSIVYTLRSVFWALLLMLMIFYGFGIAFTQAVGDYRSDQDEDVNKSDKPEARERWMIEREKLDMYWRDLPTSMFTLFQSVTSGISWAEAVMPLRTVGPAWVWFFVFFIVFMVWVIVNVITGFFCQSAIESAQHDMDLATAQLISKWQENKKFLETIFVAMDTDNSGMVTLKELESCLENEQMQAYLSSLGIEAVDAWTLLKLLDVNESGTVELEEFILGCMQLRGDAKAVHVARLAYDQRQMNSVMEEFIAHVNVQLAALTGTLSSGALANSRNRLGDTCSSCRISSIACGMQAKSTSLAMTKEEQERKRDALFSI